MPHVIGEDRNQLIFFSLDSAVPQDAFVRVIDAFVDATDLESFGFAHVNCKDEGRPAFHPSVLLKLYLYGYRYAIRSSRKLEREARTNIEALWITSAQQPGYKTIADFRKNHKGVFRKLLRSFVLLLKEWNMVDGTTIAIDSFKIRAQNSLKNNLNQAKIDRHIDYIDTRIAEYEQLLDKTDEEDEIREIQEKIELKNQRKQAYLDSEKQLKESGQEQISLTDPDARSVVLHRNIVNVGYNIQAVCDSKHKLLVACDTGDVNDSHALEPMVRQTKELLQPEAMDVLADKGYHTGSQLAACESLGVTTYVSPKETSTAGSMVFPVSSFSYDPENDFFTCPAGQIMRTNNTWHNHSGKGRKSAFRFRRYTTPACKNCQLRPQCTTAKANGRCIERSEFALQTEANQKRVHENPDYYRQRQQITEHQFGTLKRQRDFTFTLMRGKLAVLDEVGLMFIGYNLTRCVNIMGVPKLIKALIKCRLFHFWAQNRDFLSLLNESSDKIRFLHPKIIVKKQAPYQLAIA